MKTIDLLINAFKDHERMLNEMLSKLGSQIEDINEKLKSKKE